ncbi:MULTISPECIES: hypothetical protein [unclassified Rathayibacter]|uniref:hypothetical protein n=1 Tax=unclassified Rathayibacter TaxID=2609250 RepID=UPI0011B0217E|nr:MULTISPECIES: hypothetical protein [unclassified Rathayibacter]
MAIEDADEVLNRQVHEANLDPISRRVRSVAFTPRWKQDEPEGDMSHLRGAVSPQEAYQRFTALGGESRGTWGISVGEAVALELEVADDSARDDRPEDHAFIRIEDGREGKRRLARALAAHATNRGCLYSEPLEKS